MHFDLFAIGNALVDQEFKIQDEFLAKHQLQKGTMLLADAEQQAHLYADLRGSQDYQGMTSGGSAANTCVAYSALGGASFYACRVGIGEMGQAYLRGLGHANVHTSALSVADEGITGSCLVMVSPDAERTMQTYLGVSADLSVGQVDYEILKKTKWLYIEGYLSTSPSARHAVVQARQVAREHGVKIALTLSDPAMVEYARSGLDELVGDGVDLIFCNQHEAMMYTRTQTVEDAFAALLKLSQTVVITLSEQGAMIGTADYRVQVAGRAVQAVDANGAGDAFAGAFLYALQQGETLETAGQLAVLVSSEVVAHYGARLDVAQYQALKQQFDSQR